MEQTRRIDHRVTVAHPDKELKRRGLLRRIAIVLVLGVAMLTVAFRFEQFSDTDFLREQKLDATVKVIELRERIEEDIFARILDLNEFATVLGQNPDMNNTVFNIKALDFLMANPDVINIAAAPDLVVSMVFPLRGNQEVLGLDYRNNAEQFDVVNRAMRTGSAVITGPVDLVQGGRGLIMRKPVFAREVSGLPSPWGILSVVLDYDKFLDRLGLNTFEQTFDIVIMDRDAAAAGSPEILIGDPAILKREPVLLEFNFPFGDWVIAATPDGGWNAHRPDFITSWVTRLSLITGLLAAIWYILTAFERQRLAERQLSMGIEALDHGFVMFDSDRRLVAFNNKYKQIAGGSGQVRLGARYEDIVRANLDQGLIPDAVGREEEWYANWAKRIDMRKADNEQILADGRTIRAYDRPMEDGSVVGLRIDITDLKKAQVAAEAANEAKTQFMGVLSHELRTPLTVILGQAKLAKNLRNLPAYKKLLAELEQHKEAQEALDPHLETVNDQVVKMMESLERSGNHLFTLISEILDFAKIESGTLELGKDLVDTSDITDPIIEQMRPMVEHKGLELVLEREQHPVEADVKRLQQVMINLIGNATKFTDEGRITVGVRRSGDNLLFSVTDTGIGISPEHHDKIFEAFQQVDSTSGRKYGGTGLGLAISRDMARAHGGDLTVSSVPGEGSTFTVSIPCPPADALPAPRPLVA